MMKITLELPIYFKTSSLTTKLIGMNWYRNAHFQQECAIKKYYHNLVASLIPLPKPRIRGDVKMRYTLYYKNSQSDLMNIVSVIDKYVMDGLQAAGVIENDNVLNYRKCEIEVAGQDKKNPRLVCEISGRDWEMQDKVH